MHAVQDIRRERQLVQFPLANVARPRDLLLGRRRGRHHVAEEFQHLAALAVACLQGKQNAFERGTLGLYHPPRFDALQVASPQSRLGLNPELRPPSTLA